MQHIDVCSCPAAGHTLVMDVMSRNVHWCRPGDTLERAAQLMWDHACGALPVVDDHGRPIGMVTDRDVCMAAYTQGRSLSQILVRVAASQRLHCVRPDASLEDACTEMRAHRVRRLAVIDVGGNLVGMLSLSDIARCTRSADRDAIDSGAVTATIARVSHPSSPPQALTRVD